MSAKPLLILALLALAGCESESQSQYRDQMTRLRLQAWQLCIDSGGVPVEGWLGPPQMARCEYKDASK